MDILGDCELWEPCPIIHVEFPDVRLERKRAETVVDTTNKNA